MKRRIRGLVWLLVVALLWTVPVSVLYSRHVKNPAQYDAYQSPILPLTALSGAEAVTAQRHLTLDFAPYKTPLDRFPIYEIALTDTYRLTNPTDAPLTLELAYPFAARPVEAERFCSVTVDGVLTPLQLRPAVDADGAVRRAGNWEEFHAALTEHDFVAEAMMPAPESGESVIVYEFTNLVFPADATEQTSLAAEYICDSENAVVWTAGFDFFESEEGVSVRRAGFISDFSPRENRCGRLIVQGGDLAQLRMQGYRDVMADEEHVVSGGSAEIHRYETTFDEVVWLLAQEYDVAANHSGAATALITPELLYSDVMKQIFGEPQSPAVAKRHDVSGLLHAAVEYSRMLYGVFTLTLAAGEAAEVEISARRPGSCNFAWKTEWSGYEIAPALGSNLRFAAQTVSVDNANLLRTVEQNFGLDPARGITEVPLDPAQERCALHVKR